MKQRAALTAAGTVSLAAVALSVGIAVNLGILNSGTTGAGDLTLAAEQAPTSTPATTPATSAALETTTTIPPEPLTEYVTYYQDIPAPAAPAPEAPAAASPPPAREPPAESGSDGSDGGGGSGTNGGSDEDTDGPPDGGSSPSTTPATTTPTTPATAPPTTADPPSAVSYSAAGAGTITAEVSRNTMTIVSTSPSNGWTASVTRSSGQEVSVRFTGPDGTVYWKAHVEDGGVEVEMESGNEGDD